MQHFLVEEKSSVALASEYPQDPINGPASAQEYLEAKLAAGYALVSVYSAGSDGTWRFVFRVVAK